MAREAKVSSVKNIAVVLLNAQDVLVQLPSKCASAHRKVVLSSLSQKLLMCSVISHYGNDSQLVKEW